MEGIPESSCILYQNRDATVTLIDIPRSIELAQGDETTGRRLISSKPLDQSYPSVEPKSRKALSQVKPPSIKELLLYKHLQFALEEIKASQKGKPWCLPRIVGEAEERDQQGPSKRRKILEDEGYVEVEVSSSVRAREVLEKRLARESLSLGKAPFARSNPEDKPVIISFGPEETIATLPLQTCLLYGSIEETLSIFEDTANRETRFNLIILDPPWPNRSALRKQSYELAHNANIKYLLSSLPLKSYLTPDGMIAVWVTNKSAFHDMLLVEDGLFEEWGVQLTEEWIWLKVTATGEPICSIESVWRKPYEVLLVGKVVSREKAGEVGSEVKRRVIVGVPDLHSRKPNLKELLKPMLPAKYEAMEIFARNLTAGWWAWGNEVLKFQADEHWTSP